MFIIIAAPVLPLKEIWIIDEGFLRSTYGSLQSMKSSVGIDEGAQMPYLYQHYKVTPFYQASSGSATGTLQNVYNSLVQALNKDNKLPEYIIFLLDHNLILEIDFFYPGKVFVLEQIIHWLSKQVDHAISSRREKLRDICPGSVGPQPKVIWTHMINILFINRHPYPTYNYVVKLCSKFNGILGKEARKSLFSLVMQISDASWEPEFFDSVGNLTFAGKLTFGSR